MQHSEKVERVIWTDEAQPESEVRETESVATLLSFETPSDKVGDCGPCSLVWDP